MNIGLALKDVRKAKGVKQYIAATGIGITQTYLSQIESGDKTPSVEVIEKVSGYYGVPIAVMLWGSIEESDIAEEKEASLRLRKTID